jgi:heat shock protein HslJ
MEKTTPMSRAKTFAKTIALPVSMLSAVMLLSACSSSLKIPAGHWQAVAINDTAPIGPQIPSLNISKTGEVSGQGGCNRIVSHIVQKSQALVFQNSISTRMACPAALMEQESRFLSAMNNTVAMWLNPDSTLLSLKASDGAVLAVLKRQQD